MSVERLLMQLPKGEQNLINQKIPDSIISARQMNTIAPYRRGWPEGAVVHFTAGRDQYETDSLSTIKDGYEKNYTYLVIGPIGQVYQTHDIRKWGYHAGDSYWPTLGNGVSQFLIGIEVVSPGKLVEKEGRFFTWFDQEVDKKDVVYYADLDNIKRGFYKKFGDEQINSLVNTLLWFHKMNPDVFKLDQVLGHDEVSPIRKCDPGGSLVMTMGNFREILMVKASDLL